MNDTTLTPDAAITLCVHAAMRAGASTATARSLALSAVDAELAGKPNVGLAHFVDYLNALAAGRIDGQATPLITRPAPTIIASDAQGGTAHLGFDLCFEELVRAAQDLGMALFSQKNSYTCGALGYFTGRLAHAGMLALATTNGPALMAGSGGTRPVFCTNPMAFSAPAAGGPPLIIDQASSATAFVNIRKAAKEGLAIQEGWAIDADGQPTTDPAQAMKGSLLAFGGARGANIALMVEVLSAGLTGANWSLDAPSFTSGAETPGTGMLVIAIAPRLIDPEFSERLGAHLSRLENEFDVHVPGRSTRPSRASDIRVSDDVLARL